jgi:hypothetical protein
MGEGVMRKIEKLVCGAFVKREVAGQGNTASFGKTLSLHRNRIARWVEIKDSFGKDVIELEISLAGWNTPTTRSRLNAVLALLEYPYRVHTVKGQPYLGNWKIPTDEFFRVDAYLMQSQEAWRD